MSSFERIRGRPTQAPSVTPACGKWTNTATAVADDPLEGSSSITSLSNFPSAERRCLKPVANPRICTNVPSGVLDRSASSVWVPDGNARSNSTPSSMSSTPRATGDGRNLHSSKPSAKAAACDANASLPRTPAAANRAPTFSASVPRPAARKAPASRATRAWAAANPTANCSTVAANCWLLRSALLATGLP